MRRVLLIHNPIAGRRRARALAPRLEAELGRLGVEVTPSPTVRAGHATDLARQAAEEGTWDAVLVYGGDGTVREAAVGLQGSRTPLGILPGGTVNVLARALGLPSRALPAAAALLELEPHAFDVGLCGDTPFLMMASWGLDAEVMGTLDPRLKARFGQAGILLSALDRWWRYGYPDLELRADSEAVSATLAVAANIPLYGGSFRLAPDACWDDGVLDLVLFRGHGRMAALGFVAGLLRGRHLERPDVEVLRVREVELLGPAEVRSQVDGDACPEPLPVRVRVATEPVWILTPRAVTSSLRREP